jgi:hypothetical protein
MPASIAFDVFARFNDREFKLGVITCNKGSNTNWRISSALPAASVSTPPAAFDLILRSDEKVGRETTDQNDIWAGELIYPNLPVVVDQPK